MWRGTKKVVVIGGGTGTFTVLTALKGYPVNLTAIVSMADDGGSTGLLRDQYGVLPPGDVRRALVALANDSGTLRKLFTHRFKHGDLKGHSFGNLFLAALEQVTGSFAEAVAEAARVLKIEGEVVPVTLDKVRLVAELTDGKIIRGENKIDLPQGKRAPIKRIYLDRIARVNPAALQAIRSADLVLLAPGDLYTSLIPNLLVPGITAALKRTQAKVVYAVNVMTKYGETDNYTALDFVSAVERYLGRGVVDAVLVNTRRPTAKMLARYTREGAKFVEPPVEIPKAVKGKLRYVFADVLARGTLARHDNGDRLAQAILGLL